MTNVSTISQQILQNLNNSLARGAVFGRNDTRITPAGSIDLDGVKIGKLTRALTKATRALTQNDSWTVQVRRDSVRSAARCVLNKGHNKISIEIFLDADKYPADSTRFIEEVLSLYYHELSHAWWSPNYSPRTKTREWLFVANMLEDKRIETFSAACFPNLAGFFRRGFNRMIMINDGDSEEKDEARLRSAYLVAAGRRYLDPKLMQRLKDVFICPELISDIDRLTEAYKKLKASQLRKGEHLDIVNEFLDIVNKVGNELHEEIPDGDVPQNIIWLLPTPHEVGGHPDQGMPNRKEENEATQLIDEEEADTYENTNGIPREDDDDSDGDDSDSEESEPSDVDTDAAAEAAAADESNSRDSADGDGNSDGEELSGGTDGQSSDDSPATDTSDGTTGDSDDADDAQSGGNAAGSGSRDASEDIDVEDALEKLRQELEISNELEKLSADTNEEISNYRETMRGDTRIEQLNSEPTEPATQEMEDIAEQFAREMSALVAPDVDPGWDRGQPVGRINVGRYMRGDAIDTVFDRWAPGHNDAFATRATVAIDSSSSMHGGPIREASQAGWCIRRALEKHDAEVRTIAWAYGNDYDYINGDDKVGHEYPLITASGGTMPLLPLIDINMWMSTAQKNVNKLLFILTDGEWAQTDLCDVELANARAQGVYVVLVGFDCDVIHPTWGEAVTQYDQVFNIKHPMELVDVAKSVVLEMYGRIGRKVQLGGRY